MFVHTLSAAVLAAVPAVLAAQVPQFAPPAPAPLVTTTNYTGSSNGTLPTSPVVSGKVFDRFIQVLHRFYDLCFLLITV